MHLENQIVAKGSMEVLLAMCVGTSNTPRFGICPDVPSPLPSPMMSPPQSLVHAFRAVLPT